MVICIFRSCNTTSGFRSPLFHWVLVFREVWLLGRFQDVLNWGSGKRLLKGDYPRGSRACFHWNILKSRSSERWYPGLLSRWLWFVNCHWKQSRFWAILDIYYVHQTRQKPHVLECFFYFIVGGSAEPPESILNPPQDSKLFPRRFAEGTKWKGGFMGSRHRQKYRHNKCFVINRNGLIVFWRWTICLWWNETFKQKMVYTIQKLLNWFNKKHDWPSVDWNGSVSKWQTVQLNVL